MKPQSQISHSPGEHRSREMLERLRAEGLKLTAQRRAIVQQFAADESHPTAQELFERLRGDFPKMSFATVYNTLDALTHVGLSSTLRFSGSTEVGGREANAARFDPNIEPHHHAVCDRCGSVSDIPAKSLAPADAAARSLRGVAPGFELRAVERIYRGLCSSCRGKKRFKKV
ncbi:MAG: Fur family transcriptional regulator [Polyangiaceae bacterium]